MKHFAAIGVDYEVSALTGGKSKGSGDECNLSDYQSKLYA